MASEYDDDIITTSINGITGACFDRGLGKDYGNKANEKRRKELLSYCKRKSFKRIAFVDVKPTPVVVDFIGDLLDICLPREPEWRTGMHHMQNDRLSATQRQFNEIAQSNSSKILKDRKIKRPIIINDKFWICTNEKYSEEIGHNFLLLEQVVPEDNWRGEPLESEAVISATRGLAVTFDSSVEKSTSASISPSSDRYYFILHPYMPAKSHTKLLTAEQYHEKLDGKESIPVSTSALSDRYWSKEDRAKSYTRLLTAEQYHEKMDWRDKGADYRNHKEWVFTGSRILLYKENGIETYYTDHHYTDHHPQKSTKPLYDRLEKMGVVTTYDSRLNAPSCTSFIEKGFFREKNIDLVMFDNDPDGFMSYAKGCGAYYQGMDSDMDIIDSPLYRKKVRENLSKTGIDILAIHKNQGSYSVHLDEWAERKRKNYGLLSKWADNNFEKNKEVDVYLSEISQSRTEMHKICNKLKRDVETLDGDVLFYDVRKYIAEDKIDLDFKELKYEISRYHGSGLQACLTYAGGRNEVVYLDIPKKWKACGLNLKTLTKTYGIGFSYGKIKHSNWKRFHSSWIQDWPKLERKINSKD